MNRPTVALRIRTRTAVVIAVAIAAAFLFAYALSSQPAKAVRISGSSVKEMPLTDFLTQDLNPYSPEANVRIDIPLLAALASNVYQPEDAPEDSCQEATVGRIPTPGWERLTGWATPAVCNDALNGLHFEVWGRLGEDGRMYAIITFRGTIPTVLAHWCSNLREVLSPICDPTSDQYLTIAPLIDSILTGLYDDWGPDRYVVVVGHSLGGGLAELAASSSKINSIYTFDTSPVVSNDIAAQLFQAFENDDVPRAFLKKYSENAQCNYWANDAPHQNAITFNRVYESKELLEPVRWLSQRLQFRKASVARDNVVEYRTSLLSGNPIQQHSMRDLACAMQRAR